MNLILNQKNRVLGWVIICVALISVALLPVVESLNWFYLSLLTLNLLAVIAFRKQFSPSARRVAQLLVGLLFMFSGFVKGVDPLGFTFRIEDYLIAYDMEWGKPMALFASVLLNMVEFLLGFLMFVNIKPRLTTWLTSLMMLFFTFVTLADALFSPVPDCGCFGDAIILTNWQTFYKNLVLDAIVLVLFLNLSALKCRKSELMQWGTAGIMALLFISFEVYALQSLPPLDFREWEKGKKMVADELLPVSYHVTYKNNQSGAVKEYAINQLPFNDTTWVNNWSFVSQRVIDPNPRLHDLQIVDNQGNDITNGVLNSEEPVALFMSYNISKANIKGLQATIELGNALVNNGYEVMMLTPATEGELESYQNLNPDFEIYNVDDITLKVMVRSNPGLLIMQQGRVVEKWSWQNFPTVENLTQNYYK